MSSLFYEVEMIKVFIAFMLLVVTQSSFSEDKKDESIIDCSSSKEFVTTLEFLRDHKVFSVKTTDAYKMAEIVSTGCSGAAGRFITVTTALLRSSIDPITAVTTAKRFALKDESFTKMFIKAYRTSYLQNYLDMNADASLKLALKLSIDLEKASSEVLSDFKHVSEFCLNKDLNLSHSQCAELSGHVSLIGIKYEREIGEAFTDIYHYASSSSGPNLPTFKALEVAKDAITGGPESYDNFKIAYKYAVDKDGLGNDRNSSVKFAIKMAKLSSKVLSN